MMRLNKFIAPLLVAVLSLPVMAYSTNDERVDAYLEMLDTRGDREKQTMLQRLQWSGLSDPRLYDEIENRLLLKYREGNYDGVDVEMMNYEVRALGYSGNKKYRATLQKIADQKKRGKLRQHARKALLNIEDFIVWNRLIAESNFVVEGKSAEVTTYMKMLHTDNIFVQRLAARAMFHERARDKELLALTANKLKNLYLRDNLSREEQDVAAWYCKAIGQSGISEHLSLLAKITAETPYKKIKKYSSKY